MCYLTAEALWHGCDDRAPISSGASSLQEARIFSELRERFEQFQRRHLYDINLLRGTGAWADYWRSSGLSGPKRSDTVVAVTTSGPRQRSDVAWPYLLPGRGANTRLPSWREAPGSRTRIAARSVSPARVRLGGIGYRTRHPKHA